MYTQAYQQYRQTQVETAGPGQLVLMLYNGGVRFCDEAQAALDQKSLEKAHRALVRAQDIVSELLLSLNAGAGELAENLGRLYEYMHYRLVEANLKKDPAVVAEVRGMFAELGETWQELLKQPAVAPAVGGQQYDLRG